MPVFRPLSLVLIFSLEQFFGVVDAQSSVFRLLSPQRYSDMVSSKASPQRSSYRSSEDGDCVCLIPCCLRVSYDWDYHVINFSKCLSVCSRWPLLLECVGQLSRLPCGCLQTAVVYIVVILSIISISLQEVRNWTALEVSGKKREYKRLPASIVRMVRDRASCSAEQRLVCLEPARQEPYLFMWFLSGDCWFKLPGQEGKV